MVLLVEPQKGIPASQIHLQEKIKAKKKGKQKAERIVHTEQCSRSMTEARRKNKIFLQEYKDLLWHCVAGVGGFESTIAKKNFFDFLSFFSFQLSPQVQRSL